MKNFLLKIVYFFYALPFGLRGADKEIFGESTESKSSTGTHETIGQKRVAEDLLKGRESQEVKKLRYRSYRVERESKNYKYFGNGVALKKDNKKNLDLNSKVDKNFNFKMQNFEISGSVDDELKRIGTYGEEENIIKIKTIDFPMFKHSRFLESLYFSNKNGNDELILNYSIYPKKYDSVTSIFLNKLNQALNGNIKNNDSVCDFEKISFTTLKGTNIDDYIEFKFNNLKFLKIEKNEKLGYFQVFYKPKTYEYDYLLNKFYNQEMHDNFENKAKKKRENFYSLEDKNGKECSECGKIISEFDAQQSKEAVDKVLCTDCLSKIINNK